jgi:NAD-dependent dihydropyrimidine dehydrogenase PreA subunit
MGPFFMNLSVDFICPGWYYILLFEILLYIEEETGLMYMVTIDKGKCDGDGTCVNMCPQSVFKVDGGKADPVNMSECINCLTCVENCPQQAITVNEL